jgi:mRNA interferase MazF
MKPGDVVLIRLPQAAGGPPELRPALVLASLPGPFQSLLNCGISTRLGNLQPDWDEPIGPDDADYSASGLHQRSAIRLSYLYAADEREISGAIGRVAPERLERLLHRLAQRLTGSGR